MANDKSTTQVYITQEKASVIINGNQTNYEPGMKAVPAEHARILVNSGQANQMEKMESDKK